MIANLFDLINDAWQTPINVLGLEPPGSTRFRTNNGGTMTAISIVSAQPLQADGHSFKPVALFCYFGLAASLCLATYGMDLGAAWF